MILMIITVNVEFHLLRLIEIIKEGMSSIIISLACVFLNFLARIFSICCGYDIVVFM
jgi:hypothetical protein